MAPVTPSEGWRAIETAPGDTEVLVYTAQWGTIIARLNEEHGEWMSRMQVPVTLAADDGPTHWLPLPEPPEGAHVKADGDAPKPGAAPTAP